VDAQGIEPWTSPVLRERFLQKPNRPRHKRRRRKNGLTDVEVPSIGLPIRSTICVTDEACEGGEVDDGFQPQHSKFLNRKAAFAGMLNFRLSKSDPFFSFPKDNPALGMGGV
jgi:hypothetical protein